MNISRYDALIIGGGFYGSVVALYLATHRGLKNILIVEAECELLSRASYNNQARAHNGYHYPRSFTTAYRSRINLPKFISSWPEIIKSDFVKLYAIARRNSKVTARQFERFCREIGAPILPTNPKLKSLFNPHLIEEVFMVEEYAFDSSKLAQRIQGELKVLGINISFKTKATKIVSHTKDSIQALLVDQFNSERLVSSKYIFNCTYSGLNQIFGEFKGTFAKLKQEITEIALVNVPPELRDLGITVMDGPFFSIMPFPSKNLHSLSHVRYTPHLHWEDMPRLDPYQVLKDYNHVTRVDRMIRDVGRYIPSVLNVKYMESLFEVKTVLVKNEGDDGRPILFEKHPLIEGFYSILGGKIDNIYDVLEKLDNEIFEPE